MIAVHPTQLAPRQKAITWARRIVADPDVLYLDTETTGLGPDAEIVDLAVIDRAGRVVYESLVRPRRPIPAEATAVHGIAARDVEAAPTFDDLYLRFAAAIRGKVLCIYNGAYDVGIVRQVCAAHGLASPVGSWQCAMLAFADFRGEPSVKQRPGETFRWHKLADACAHFGIDVAGFHRARSDAEACRLVVAAMADANSW